MPEGAFSGEEKGSPGGKEFHHDKARQRGPAFLEVFAGTARLTQAARSAGVEVHEPLDVLTSKRVKRSTDLLAPGELEKVTMAGKTPAKKAPAKKVAVKKAVPVKKAAPAKKVAVKKAAPATQAPAKKAAVKHTPPA